MTSTAEVIPFPIRERRAYLSKTAARIHHSRTEKEASANYRRAVDSVRSQMERQCVDPVRIAAELQAFNDGLHGELYRLFNQSAEPEGDAA